MTDIVATTPQTDGPDCPPDDLACLLKILLNGGNTIAILSLPHEHTTEMYWGCMRKEMALPEGFNEFAPQMIAALHKMEVAAMDYQKLYRKACQYRGQGLPPEAR